MDLTGAVDHSRSSRLLVKFHKVCALFRRAPPSLISGCQVKLMVWVDHAVRKASKGIEKNTPLSKLPSPKLAEDTLVLVTQAPILVPLLKRLETSNVAPLSPAKY